MLTEEAINAYLDYATDPGIVSRLCGQIITEKERDVVKLWGDITWENHFEKCENVAECALQGVKWLGHFNDINRSVPNNVMKTIKNRLNLLMTQEQVGGGRIKSAAAITLALKTSAYLIRRIYQSMQNVFALHKTWENFYYRELLATWEKMYYRFQSYRTDTEIVWEHAISYARRHHTSVRIGGDGDPEQAGEADEEEPDEDGDIPMSDIPEEREAYGLLKPTMEAFVNTLPLGKVGIMTLERGLKEKFPFQHETIDGIIKQLKEKNGDALFVDAKVQRQLTMELAREGVFTIARDEVDQEGSTLKFTKEELKRYAERHGGDHFVYSKMKKEIMASRPTRTQLLKEIEETDKYTPVRDRLKDWLRGKSEERIPREDLESEYNRIRTTMDVEPLPKYRAGEDIDYDAIVDEREREATIGFFAKHGNIEMTTEQYDKLKLEWTYTREEYFNKIQKAIEEEKNRPDVIEKLKKMRMDLARDKNEMHFNKTKIDEQMEEALRPAVQDEPMEERQGQGAMEVEVIEPGPEYQVTRADVSGIEDELKKKVLRDYFMRNIGGGITGEKYKELEKEWTYTRDQYAKILNKVLEKAKNNVEQKKRLEGLKDVLIKDEKNELFSKYEVDKNLEKIKEETKLHEAESSTSVGENPPSGQPQKRQKTKQQPPEEVKTPVSETQTSAEEQPKIGEGPQIEQQQEGEGGKNTGKRGAAGDTPGPEKKARTASFEEQLGVARQEIDELKKTLTKEQEKNRLLTRENERAQQEITDKIADGKRTDKVVENLNKYKSKLESQNKKHLQTQEILKHRLDEASQQMKAAETRYQEEKTWMENDISNLKIKMGDITAEATQREKVYKENEERINKVLSEKETTVKSLKKELDGAETHIEELLKTSKQREALEEKNVKLKDDLEYKNQELHKMRDKMEKTKIDLEAMIQHELQVDKMIFEIEQQRMLVLDAVKGWATNKAIDELSKLRDLLASYREKSKTTFKRPRPNPSSSASAASQSKVIQEPSPKRRDTKDK